MNKYQEALDNIKNREEGTPYLGIKIFEDDDENIKLLQELVDKFNMLSSANIAKMIKAFVPIDAPYCSSCMLYAESDCATDKCYLRDFINALGINNID
jgi:hypothetical protein